MNKWIYDFNQTTKLLELTFCLSRKRNSYVMKVRKCELTDARIKRGEKRTFVVCSYDQAFHYKSRHFNSSRQISHRTYREIFLLHTAVFTPVP